MSRTALLLMDLQNGIVSRIADDPEFLKRIEKVAAAARAASMPIIHVVVKFRPGYPDVNPRNKSFAAIKSGAMPFSEGEAATEIHPAVKPQSGDIVVTKRRVGAFSGSDLEVVLRSQDVDHLVLTGIATGGVVLSTLRVAADMDYQLTVLSDCCADSDEEVHRVLMQKVFPRQADVITGQEWVQQRSPAASART